MRPKKSKPLQKDTLLTIEGVKLSNHEVERLLASFNPTSFTTRDEQEVAGYARVMERVFECWADLPLEENHLKQLDAELLQFSDKGTRQLGEYKTHPNHVVAFGPDGNMLGIDVHGTTLQSFFSPPRMARARRETFPAFDIWPGKKNRTADRHRFTQILKTPPVAR